MSNMKNEEIIFGRNGVGKVRSIVKPLDDSLRQITYKNTTHLYNYAFNTDCGLSVPPQGNHLKSVKQINNLNEVNCEKCLSTLSSTN